MDDRLRRSAAHVLVADVDNPELDGGAAHHLHRVLRLRAGEPVTVTDGAGRWRCCTFTGAALDPAGDVRTTKPSERRPTVAVAPPKGERLEWLVAKCTEVGVDRIVLLDAERSVVRWDGERGAKQVARLTRVATEAAMQSRRVWLPRIEGPTAAADVLSAAAVADPNGRPMTPQDTTIAVGPEGGWSPAELEVARDVVSLGPNVLRVETAAVVAATLMVSHR